MSASVSPMPAASVPDAPGPSPPADPDPRSTHAASSHAGDADPSNHNDSDGSSDAPLARNPRKRALAVEKRSSSRQESVPKNKKGRRVVSDDDDMDVDDFSSETEEESESETSDDDDVPLAKAKTGKGESTTKAKAKESAVKRSRTPKTNATARDVSESPAKVKQEKTPVKKQVAKKEASVKKEAKNSPANKKNGAKSKNGVKKETAGADEEEADDEQHQDDDEEEQEYAWWEGNVDNSEKWKTMSHNGPVFPPPYVPHGVKMKYDGIPIELEPNSEEVATFFAGVIGTDYEKNKTFCKNFFTDFLSVLALEKKPSPIKSFEKCDFTPIAQYLAQLKEKRKQMTKEEKALIKKEKQELEDKYGWAIFDGRKEKVGNFRIEPPGLFRGRGDHPKTGTLKLRVQPEQVTINIGADAEVPPAPEGHSWGNVVHDNTVAWLATWKENVNENIKYVLMAATSSLKGQSDLKKFQKARELKNHIDKIRKEYTKGLGDKLMATRQLCTALYFIDRLALRAGNEKGEDEADTVGCCSLRLEHVTLELPNKVIFDFLGKDSIRYYNEVEVTDEVFKNIKIFKRLPKKEGDLLFDRLTTQILNKNLTQHMQGLTAKVFRTFNASWTFQQELNKNTPEGATVQEKLLAYNRANRQVAILCNHQRAVPKGHSVSMGKMQDKTLGLKYERSLVKAAILENDPKLKKSRPELTEAESDVDDEFIARYEKSCREKHIEAERKALEKENERRRAEGLKEIGELEKKKKFVFGAEAYEGLSLERLEKKLADLGKKIENAKLTMIDKDENKTTALGTSKINYIDPRISVAWAKKHDVDLDKIFNKSLREKFRWASFVDAGWEF
ncbi:DNA topoisomerase 1 [Entophlyctis sp. JEL0112]|nr:DNA topoisomerase 1 [Entophlyctis sp. JEL0112]